MSKKKKNAKEESEKEIFDSHKTKILKQLIETHHECFYTIISVIQASCFGFLGLVCFEEGKHYGLYEWLLVANTVFLFALVWNSFIRGFVILSYIPKFFDGLMPFLLGSAQCFSAYCITYSVYGWFWGVAALATVGLIGHINGEFNARLNKEENKHVTEFYFKNLRIAQASTLLLIFFCVSIAYFTDLPRSILTLLSFVVTLGFAITDEILWLRLEKFARIN